MADPLTIVGGIASFAQVLGGVVKTTQAIYNVCHAVQDAPDELRRINETLLALKLALESTQTQVGGFDDDELLPPDLRCIMQTNITSIHDDVIALKQKCHDYASPSSITKRERLKWAVLERRVVGNLLERLKGSESSLTCVLQLINIRMSLLVISSQKKLAQTGPGISPRHRASGQHSSFTKVQIRTAIVNIDSWLRKCGLYGFLSVVSGIDNDEWRSRICVGFKPPAWLWSSSMTLDLQFTSVKSSRSGIRILPGSIQFQNQVPLNSPFMVACAKGDVRAISQHLIDRKGHVGDRAICCGKTPLLVRANYGRIFFTATCMNR